jgi:glycosyltransferase involved in cell wall biosynthesis
MPECQEPEISVIVSVREAADSIRDALRSLAEQEGIESAEVVVADGSSDGSSEIIAREFPFVRHLRFAPESMPVLKGRAIEVARGPIVAILDAGDRAEPGWLCAARQGLERSGAEAPEAIGGEVLLDGPRSGINAAGYLFEYGAFAPPLAAGRTLGDLPGNNVAYRARALRETCADLLPAGFWKPFFHRRIRERGGELHLHPPMRVRHRIRLGARAFLARRFHYGRAFGAMRFATAGPGRKILYLLLVPCVPALLCLRHVHRSLARAESRALLPGALPVLLLLCCSWGLGEWLGTWLGAGRSRERVY